MTKKALLERLEILSKKPNAEWLSELDERKLQELEFHNQDRDQNIVSNLPSDTYEKLHGNKKFYRTVKLSTDYVDTWIKQNSPGKIFLDYACGNGVNAIKAARAGADLSVGLDISDVSIRNACLSAEENGVSGITYFIQGDCENTGLPVECVDVIICSGMLHHLDLNYAFPELKRILKPGGVILAVEACDYNPFIKLYRNLTPQMRTEWEKSHILSYKDIAFASKFFKIKEIRHWHLFSILGVFVPVALPLLNAIDSFVLRIPLIKMMSWMFTFELHKK
ncbi:MAG: class I SAM-dependent methyltransferase [Spirochaetota bacterium]